MATVKSVEVSTPSTSASKPDTHPNGYSFKIEQGHLFVQDGGQRNVAVYAPNAWSSAKVVQEG